jgi:hypothetical protein
MECWSTGVMGFTAQHSSTPLLQYPNLINAPGIAFAVCAARDLICRD